MIFKILSIFHGWFEVDFNREFVLINSNFMGCDAPLLLLQALGDLLENKVAEAWLCWQDEPGAYVLNLERQGTNLFVQIYDTDHKSDSMNLDYSGISLADHISKSEYKKSADFIKTVTNILEEFALYENGNGRGRYEAHWGEFPILQYHRLKKLLQQSRYVV